MAHTSVRFISSMRGNLEIAKPFASPLIFLSFEAPHFLFFPNWLPRAFREAAAALTSHGGGRSEK